METHLFIYQHFHLSADLTGLHMTAFDFVYNIMIFKVH